MNVGGSGNAGTGSAAPSSVPAGSEPSSGGPGNSGAGLAACSFPDASGSLCRGPDTEGASADDAAPAGSGSTSGGPNIQGASAGSAAPSAPGSTSDNYDVASTVLQDSGSDAGRSESDSTESVVSDNADDADDDADEDDGAGGGQQGAQGAGGVPPLQLFEDAAAEACSLGVWRTLAGLSQLQRLCLDVEVDYHNGSLPDGLWAMAKLTRLTLRCNQTMVLSDARRRVQAPVLQVSVWVAHGRLPAGLLANARCHLLKKKRAVAATGLLSRLEVRTPC